MKIEDLQKRLAQYEAGPTIREQIDTLEAQKGAAEMALAQAGSVGDDSHRWPGVAWLLVWQEYARRTQQFQFVGEQGLRSKTDPKGNSWSIQPMPNLDGLDPVHREMYMAIADALGYDPLDPPKGYFLLHCQPNRGAYEIACVNIEKAQNATREAQKQYWVAEQAKNAAMERGDRDKASKMDAEMDLHQEAILKAKREFAECQAVLDTAVQRFWLVSVEGLEGMERYSMELKCATAAVVPQKKHTNLPNWRPPEEARVPSADGSSLAGVA